MRVKGFLKNLAFHKNDRPRGWVRRLLFKKIAFLKEPRFVFHPLVFKRNGEPHPSFAPWINIGLTARQHFKTESLDKIRDEIIENNKLMQVKTVTILSPPHAEVQGLDRMLSALGVQVRLMQDGAYDDDLYIVLGAQSFETLPPPMKRIIVQTERADSFTDDYMEVLSQSLAVFDYSSDNIQILQDNGMSYRDIFELAEPSADITPVVKFRFYRGLLGLGMIDYARFYRLTDDWMLPADKIMLGLPENGLRRKYAMTQIPQDVGIFDGLRDRVSWLGCAMSYKYLAQKALDAGFETLQVYEDDAEFPDDYQRQYDIITDYLAVHKGQWDVFSGMLVETIKQEMIASVEDYKSIRFVHVDFFVSTVYCIYARSFLEKLADYPLEVKGALPIKRHIDRYLGNGAIRCVTTAPFLMNHAPSLDSSIWPVGNDAQHMVDTFQIAQKNIAEFSDAFMKNG